MDYRGRHHCGAVRIRKTLVKPMTDLVTVALIGTCGVIFSAMMQFVTVVKVNRIS